MIPKKFKYALTLTCLTLGTVCLVTGCKKKHDKIDLSSTQASETSVETAPAAPETTASSETTDSNLTIEPGIEQAVGQPQGSSAGGAATSASVHVTMQTYQNGKVSIQYPSISDISNAGINNHIKENALSILKLYEIDEAKDTVSITCKVLSATKNRIVMRYEGSVSGEDSMHPSNVFYTNTVNLSSGADIRLSDLVDPATLASYVLSGNCVFPEADQELAEAANEFVTGMDQASYIDLFRQADFPCQEYFPECFSYEYEGAIYFTLPVPHALGDSILAVYTPENK